MYTTPNY